MIYLCDMSSILAVVRWPLLVNVLVWQLRSATDCCLPGIKFLMTFAPTVVVSHAIPVIVVNIAMMGESNCL